LPVYMMDRRYNQYAPAEFRPIVNLRHATEKFKSLIKQWKKERGL
jgi:hypothetical protein